MVTIKIASYSHFLYVTFAFKFNEKLNVNGKSIWRDGRVVIL